MVEKTTVNHKILQPHKSIKENLGSCITPDHSLTADRYQRALPVTNTVSGSRKCFSTSLFMSLVVEIGMKIRDCKADDAGDRQYMLQSTGRICSKRVNNFVNQILPLSMNAIGTCIRQYRFLSVFYQAPRKVLRN